MAKANNSFEITWGSLWRILVIAGLAVSAYFAQDALLALVLAIIISSALDVPVAFLNERFRIPRLLGATMIFLTALFIFAVAIYIILPVVVLEVSTLAQSLAGTSFGKMLSDAASVLKVATQNLTLVNIGKVTEKIMLGSSPVFSTLGNVVSGLTFTFSVFIISFYLTITRDGVGRFLRAVFPDESEDHIIEIYYRAKKKIARWFQAQMILSAVMFALVSVGLWILGVKYALVIGLLAAIFEIMPVVGPIFSGGVGTLIAVSDSLMLGVYTLSLFIVIQQLENHVLVPLFMKKVVDIHPVIALFSLMVGFQLFGITGMIISVPAAVVVQEMVESRIERRNHN